MRASAILVAYSVAKQTWLQKNDVMAAYRLWGDHWAGVVLDSDGFRNYRINYARFGSYFDSLKAVYLYRHERLQAGFLVNLHRCSTSIVLRMRAARRWKLRLSMLDRTGEWNCGSILFGRRGWWLRRNWDYGNYSWGVRGAMLREVVGPRSIRWPFHTTDLNLYS